MAAFIYYFGIICTVLVAFKQAEAVKCYRCIRIEVEGAEEKGTDGSAENGGGDNGENAEAQTQSFEYGNEDCKEDGDEFRTDVVTQDECSATLELGPIAAYKEVGDIITWADLLGGEGSTTPSPDSFQCHKTKFTLSSSENDARLTVWYRGCAHTTKDECFDVNEMKEKHIFQDIYAQMIGVKKHTVSLEGEQCTCEKDTCNSAVTSHVSTMLAAVCGFIIYALVRN